MTMEATGIVDELRRKGRYRLFDGVDYTLPPEERIEIRRQGLLADLYISGINAITEEGALSHIHCTIIVRNGKVMVKDNGSSCGTWVDDVKLAPNQETVVHRGHRIYLGSREQSFVLNS